MFTCVRWKNISLYSFIGLAVSSSFSLSLFLSANSIAGYFFSTLFILSFYLVIAVASWTWQLHTIVVIRVTLIKSKKITEQQNDDCIVNKANVCKRPLHSIFQFYFAYMTFDRGGCFFSYLVQNLLIICVLVWDFFFKSHTKFTLPFIVGTLLSVMPAEYKLFIIVTWINEHPYFMNSFNSSQNFCDCNLNLK